MYIYVSQKIHSATEKYLFIFFIENWHCYKRNFSYTFWAKSGRMERRNEDFVPYILQKMRKFWKIVPWGKVRFCRKPQKILRNDFRCFLFGTEISWKMHNRQIVGSIADECGNVLHQERDK